MSFTNYQKQPELAQHLAELPDCLDIESTKYYYGMLPTMVRTMSTEDLIGRANDPSYDGRNVSDDPNSPRFAGTPLSNWERGKTKKDAGVLELSAVRYARLNPDYARLDPGKLVWDALHEAVLPAVDPTVQAEIRKTLFERALSVVQPDQSPEIFDKFIQTIAKYSPADPNHSWQLSRGLYEKFEAVSYTHLRAHETDSY